MSISFKRLRGQFEDSPKLKNLLDGIFGEVDDLKTPTDDIRTKTDLDNAVGKQIDLNGLDLAIDRSGLSDANYILLQKSKIDANTSGGDHNRLLKISEDVAKLFTKDSSPPDPIPSLIIEDFPANFRINLTTTIKAEFTKIFGELIRKARGPGIGARIIHGGADDGSNRFIFDSGTQGFDGGGLFTAVI